MARRHRCRVSYPYIVCLPCLRTLLAIQGIPKPLWELLDLDYYRRCPDRIGKPTENIGGA